MRRLPDVLAALGFDQTVDGVVGVVADRLDLLVAVVEDGLQRGVFDAGDVARRVVGVAQVLHDCRVVEELRGEAVQPGCARGLADGQAEGERIVFVSRLGAVGVGDQRALALWRCSRCW